MLRWGISLVALLAILGACFEPALPRGDHFGQGGGAVYGPAALAPGDEVASMIHPLENRSGESLTIESIEPFGANRVGEVADVVSIELAPHPESGPIVAMGGYAVYPPARLRSGGRCLVQPVEPFSEFTLEPGERAVIAVRFRGLAPGKARIRGLRIVYEVGGERFEHHMRVGVRLSVKENASSHVHRRLQRACADRVEALR